MCDCTKCSRTLEMKIEDLEETIELLKEQLERANKWNEMFNFQWKEKPYWYVEPFYPYYPYRINWISTGGTYVGA